MRLEIEKRYAQSLKRADSFLQSKKSIAKGTSISNSRELSLLRNDAECPICGTRFRGKNHNTEHIHPRGLGGLNDADNKIQMCTACNHDRNLTMQTMLGNPSYFKNYSKIKTDVDEFILWSELTVDDGLEAGKLFPRPQQLFMEARFANNMPPIPQRAYGRFSTWDKDDHPNHKFNKAQFRTPPIGHIQSKKKIGLVTRFFDKLFGYEPKKTENNLPSVKMKSGDSTIEEVAFRVIQNLEKTAVLSRPRKQKTLENHIGHWRTGIGFKPTAATIVHWLALKKHIEITDGKVKYNF